MQPDERNDKKSLYNVSLTDNIKIKFEQSSCPYENYACKIRDEQLNKFEEDIWIIDDIKDEPCHSEGVSDDDDARVERGVPSVTGADTGSGSRSGVKDHTEIKDECRLSLEDIKQENIDASSLDYPTQTIEDVIKQENIDASSHNHPTQTIEDVEDIQDEVKGGCLHQNLRTCLDKDEDKILTEQPHGEVNEQDVNTNRKDVNKSEVNFNIFNRIDQYNSSELRKRNTDTICPSDKPYYCDLCSYRSKYKSRLIRHLRIHTGEKPFSCDVCSFKTNTKGNLKSHLKTHTGEKPFSCDVCSYKSNRKSHLQQHLRTHTGEKPFSCDVCLYKSNRKSHLQQHLRTHTGEKPFSCDVCSYKCIQKGNFKNHLRTHR